MLLFTQLYLFLFAPLILFTFLYSSLPSFTYIHSYPLLCSSVFNFYLSPLSFNVFWCSPLLYTSLHPSFLCLFPPPVLGCYLLEGSFACIVVLCRSSIVQPNTVMINGQHVLQPQWLVFITLAIINKIFTTQPSFSCVCFYCTAVTYVLTALLSCVFTVTSTIIIWLKSPRLILQGFDTYVCCKYKLFLYVHITHGQWESDFYHTESRQNDT